MESVISMLNLRSQLASPFRISAVHSDRPSDVGMSYTTYSVRAKLAARHQWMLFDDLSAFVRQHQFIGFHVKANRDRIRDAFIQMRGTAPYSRSVRFPEDFYVHLGDRGVRTWIEQLLHALDLPDRLVERGRIGENENSLYDAKRAFDVAFSNLATIVDSTDERTLLENGVYERASFEAAFVCVWGPT
nr:MAG: coat protein [Wufeng shrew martellivirus 1]